MQRKKSTKDTRNAAYKKLKQQYDLYVEFNTANQRELKRLTKLESEIKQLKRDIKDRIAMIDKRIAVLDGPNYHDETKRINNLHGEALVYENVLERLKSIHSDHFKR